MATLIEDDAPLTEFELLKLDATRWARWQRSETLRRLDRRVRGSRTKPSDVDLARLCAARGVLQRRVNRRARRSVLIRWVTTAW